MKRILLIDDDKTTSCLHKLVIDVIVKDYGLDAEVHVITDLVQLKSCSLSKYDLVVIELFIRKLSGVDIIEYVRDRFVHIPIILISNGIFELEEFIHVGHVSGAAIKLLDKPLDHREFGSYIKGAFKERSNEILN